MGESNSSINDLYRIQRGLFKEAVHLNRQKAMLTDLLEVMERMEELEELEKAVEGIPEEILNPYLHK